MCHTQTITSPGLRVTPFPSCLATSEPLADSSGSATRRKSRHYHHDHDHGNHHRHHHHHQQQRQPQQQQQELHHQATLNRHSVAAPQCRNTKPLRCHGIIE